MSKLDLIYETIRRPVDPYDINTFFVLKPSKNKDKKLIYLRDEFIIDLERCKLTRYHNQFSTYMFIPALTTEDQYRTEIQIKVTGIILVLSLPMSTSFYERELPPILASLKLKFTELQELKASLNNNHNLKLDL